MNTMSRMTLRHLNMLYDNMVAAMEGSDHTEASRAAERILFGEAARISGQTLTGYTHGDHPLCLVFQDAAAAAGLTGKPW